MSGKLTPTASVHTHCKCVLWDFASVINSRILSTGVNQFLTETVRCMAGDANELHTLYTHYTLTRNSYKLLYFVKHTPHTRYNYPMTRQSAQLLNLTVHYKSKDTSITTEYFPSRVRNHAPLRRRSVEQYIYL